MASTTEDNKVNATNCNKGMWLLKLPKTVNDIWTQDTPETDLGYVTHNKTTGEV
jgi:hypothetical protein